MLDPEVGSIDYVGARVIVALQFCKGLCHVSMHTSIRKARLIRVACSATYALMSTYMC